MGKTRGWLCHGLASHATCPVALVMRIEFPLQPVDRLVADMADGGAET